MRQVEFFFDCSSPWTYLAFHNIQPIVAETESRVIWRPILVGGVFNAVNPSIYRSRDNPVPAKEAYQGKDLADWARWSGIRLRWRPSIFPVNAVRAMRGCIVADREGKLVDHATRLFEAYWRDDRDISNEAVLREIAQASGLDLEAYLRALASDEIKAELRANTDDLIARGGFGSPTIFLDGTDMYFGNDRLPLVRAALLSDRSET